MGQTYMRKEGFTMGGKTIGDYRDDLRTLRIELDQVKRRRADAECELNHYRRYVRDKFERYVEMTAQNKYPDMIQLVMDHAKFFNERTPFDWNMLPRAF